MSTALLFVVAAVIGFAASLIPFLVWLSRYQLANARLLATANSHNARLAAQVDGLGHQLLAVTANRDQILEILNSQSVATGQSLVAMQDAKTEAAQAKAAYDALAASCGLRAEVDVSANNARAQEARWTSRSVLPS